MDYSPHPHDDADDKPIVYVVDDDAPLRRVLQIKLWREGFEVGVFDSAESFLEQCEPGRHGCVLLDLVLPGLDGLGLQAMLAERGIDLPIVFMTASGDVERAARAMRGGAVTVLKKPFALEEMLDWIRRALEHQRHARYARARESESAARLARLTPRQRQVLELVVAGLSSKQVAAELGASPRTIDVHRAHIMRKLGVHCVADMVALAVRGQNTPGLTPGHTPGLTPGLTPGHAHSADSRPPTPDHATMAGSPWRADPTSRPSPS